MSYSEHQLAVMSARKYNILPITSICNLNCIFCSHQGNPPQVQTFSTGHRPLEVVKELISFLQPGHKIVIGESITRICEGEPVTHPQFKQILKLLRSKFPDTLIKLTTNGTELTAELVSFLADLEPIELNVSVNSNSLAGRNKLMNDRNSQVAKGVEHLQQQGLIYHGSIVALPQVVGWDDIEATIGFLDQFGAQTVRIFVPGYTKFSPDYIKFDLSLWSKLETFVHRMQLEYQVPITLEPPRIEDLTAQLEGVIGNSPADKAGLQPHDKIVTIDQQEVISRVDAFNQLIKSNNPEVKIMRQGRERNLTIDKQAGDKSGVVVNYDLDPDLIALIRRLAADYQAEQLLILASQLATDRLRAAADNLLSELKVRVITVKNDFFGGSIMSAGLLTVADFRRTLQEHQEQLADFDLVLLPEVAFDFAGYDLVEESYRQLASEFAIDLETIS